MSRQIDLTARDQAKREGSYAPAPRVSGFVSNGSDGAVVEAIRAANLDLERQSNGYMSVPLAVAIEQRNLALRELCQERAAFEERRSAELATLQVRVREQDSVLEQLRHQLRDAERELEHLRDDTKTTIGIGRVSQAAPSSARTLDSGEHSFGAPGSLQSALESAWQDVQDARARISKLEEERDAAVRELDEVRLEVYAKLEIAQDEVIELQTHVDDLRRTFDDARDEWESENFRLKTEVDEARQALQQQLEVNAHLRRAMAGDMPSHEETVPAPSVRETLPHNHDNVLHVHTSAPALQAAIPRSAVRDVEATQPVPLIAQLPATDSTVTDPDGSEQTAFRSTHARPISRAGARTATTAQAFATPTHAGAPEMGQPNVDAETDELQRRSRGFGIGRLFQRK